MLPRPHRARRNLFETQLVAAVRAVRDLDGALHTRSRDAVFRAAATARDALRAAYRARRELGPHIPYDEERLCGLREEGHSILCGSLGGWHRTTPQILRAPIDDGHTRAALVRALWAVSDALDDDRGGDR